MTLDTQKSPPSCEEQFTRRVYWSWNLLYRWIKRGRSVHLYDMMAVSYRTVLERVFSIYSGILNTSKPFKFICQRNLSQAQATDARKLQAMVNVLSCLYPYVAVSADQQVILAQLLSFWFLRQMSKLKYNQREFLKVII